MMTLGEYINQRLLGATFTGIEGCKSSINCDLAQAWKEVSDEDWEQTILTIIGPVGNTLIWITEDIEPDYRVFSTRI